MSARVRPNGSMASVMTLQQELDLGLVGVADHGGLGPADDGDVVRGRHQKILFTRSGSSMSGSPSGIQPSRLP